MPDSAEERGLERTPPDGQPLPSLPRFNWGAFLIPPVWGVAHGLWAGVFFLPLWAFVDNLARSSNSGPVWMRGLALVAAIGTLAFQYEYASTANRLAWRRSGGRLPLEAFLRRERLWAAGGVVTIAVLAVWAGMYLAR